MLAAPMGTGLSKMSLDILSTYSFNTGYCPSCKQGQATLHVAVMLVCDEKVAPK